MKYHDIPPAHRAESIVFGVRDTIDSLPPLPELPPPRWWEWADPTGGAQFTDGYWWKR